MYRYVKAVAALVGGLTPAAVVGALALFGVHLDPDHVVGLLAVTVPFLSALATALAPANAPKA